GNTVTSNNSGGEDFATVDQGALRAETAKVNGGEVFAARVVGGDGVAGDDLRQFVDQLFNGDGAGHFQLLGANGRDRADGREVLALQARTGNDDFGNFA